MPTEKIDTKCLSSTCNVVVSQDSCNRIVLESTNLYVDDRLKKEDYCQKYNNESDLLDKANFRYNILDSSKQLLYNRPYKEACVL